MGDFHLDDIGQILLEVENRWLRPNEICEILRNYEKFYLTPEPPVKPPAGSLFLFDRKALRYFRKDGHQWRKKRDGKNIQEAHEKLKSGRVDVLHCYYAHGENNANFQRRSYWMLDPKLQHIVLVHYREVKEGNQCTTASGVVGNSRTSCLESSPSSLKINSPLLDMAVSDRHTPPSEYEDVDSGDISGASYFTNEATDNELLGCREDNLCHTYSEQLFNVVEPGFPLVIQNHLDSVPFGEFGFSNAMNLSTWSGTMSSSRTMPVTAENSLFEQGGGSISLTNKVPIPGSGPYQASKDSLDDRCGLFNVVTREYSWNAQEMPQEHLKVEAVEHFREFFRSPVSDENHKYEILHQSSIQTDNDAIVSPMNTIQSMEGEIQDPGFLRNDTGNEVDSKKLDSFESWMNEEISKNCDDILMKSNSSKYCNVVDTTVDQKEVSSLSCHTHLDVNSSVPSLPHEQLLFSIVDFSPDWAYSGDETKILISGIFLRDIRNLHISQWCCMFGEIEVPADVLSSNVIRCQVPRQPPGRVPFYITRNDKLACSEIHEFGYRKKPRETSEREDEIQLQLRLAKILITGTERKTSDYSISCDKFDLKKALSSIGSVGDTEWENIEAASKDPSVPHENTRHALIQKLLKCQLYQWFLYKSHGDKGLNVLDDEGQGVIHLAAALGFDWIMEPIIASGLNPNFRDKNGRTALHWAAFFGREETVTTLVRLGAAPGAVEDPTSRFPGGRTAADLASSRNHKGIAGYLAEADLISHLSVLTMRGNMESIQETCFLENSDTLEQRNDDLLDEDGEKRSSLRRSLLAVRNSTQAAAQIQAAFRIQSFRLKKTNKTNVWPQVPSEVIAFLSQSKAQKKHHSNDPSYIAAMRIQQKYRAWKGRKEFLKIRYQIIKIQAHIRGHQVRKQYKKVVWSVSILEKVILRWRRKGAGLRGFRASDVNTPLTGNLISSNRKPDEYDFLHVGRKQKEVGVEKALERVKSMARHPEAREQYMRLVTSFRKKR